MSNYDPEAPTPKNPDYTPPPIIGQDVLQSWAQYRDIVEGIAVANDKIRDITGGPKSMLAGHAEDLNKMNDSVASQQELLRQRNELEQRNVLIRQNALKIEQQYAAFQKQSTEQKMADLKRLGVIRRNETGTPQARIGGRVYNEGELQSLMDSGDPNLLNVLNEQVGRAMADAAAKQAPRKIERILDAVEEAGIQQLRYGQLPLQDILRAAGTLAGKRYQARMPLPNVPGFEGEGAASGGRISSFITSALGMAGRGLPVAGQAVAIGQVLGRTVSNLYGRTYGGLYADPARSGQLTGQGWRAGIGARLEAFRLGANPFDLLSMGQATEIVQQARTRGFTGGQGSAVMQGMADVVNRLGIEVGTAADFFATSMRQGGMSVDQVRQEMLKFHDAAFNLNMNINDYTQQILQNTATLRSSGAGAAAPGIAQALTAAAPVGFRTGAGQQAFQQIFQAARGEIAARLGGGANVLNLSSQRFANRSYRMLDTVLQQQIRFAEASLPPGQRTPNDIANYLSQVGPYTQGVDPAFLATYIGQMRHGRGVAAQQVFRQSEQAWSQGLAANRMGNSEVMRIANMTAEQRARLGITESMIPSSRMGGPTAQYRDRAGNILSGQAYRRAIGHYSHTEVETMRNQLLSSIGPYLTKAQRDELATADPMNVDKILRDISQGRGPQVGASVQAGLVTIRLKPGMESKFFELQKAQDKAVSSGAIAPNTLPSSRP